MDSQEDARQREMPSMPSHSASTRNPRVNLNGCVVARALRQGRQECRIQKLILQFTSYRNVLDPSVQAELPSSRWRQEEASVAFEKSRHASVLPPPRDQIVECFQSFFAVWDLVHLDFASTLADIIRYYLPAFIGVLGAVIHTGRSQILDNPYNTP